MKRRLLVEKEITPEQIQAECEEMYSQIQKAQNRLEELRDICIHSKTFVGNYSFDRGHIEEGEICTHCLTFIRKTGPYHDL